MREIKEALKQLAAICNKYSLSGNFNTVNDLDNAFPTNLPRSTDVDCLCKYYNLEKLKIETGFTPIKIHSVSELSKAQNGYEYLPNGQPVGMTTIDGKIGFRVEYVNEVELISMCLAVKIKGSTSCLMRLNPL
ncbi:hypothetical protein L2X67_22230 [Enterobacter ludwigii]|nr:hypothetical protein [Enterobacter ludwigii]